MRLYHATPRKNLRSILKHGLLTSKSQGKRPLIWLHADENWGWGIEHVAQRHSVDQDDVVILCVDLPIRWRLGSTMLAGVVTSAVDIPPERIQEQSYLAGRLYRSLSDVAQ